MAPNRFGQSLVHGLPHSDHILIRTDPGARKQVRHPAKVRAWMINGLLIEKSFEEDNVFLIRLKGRKPLPQSHDARLLLGPPMFWLHTIAKIHTSKAGGWLRGGFVKKALPGCFIPLSKRGHPGKRQTHSKPTQKMTSRHGRPASSIGQCPFGHILHRYCQRKVMGALFGV